MIKKNHQSDVGYPESATYLHDSMYDESNSKPFSDVVSETSMELKQQEVAKIDFFFGQLGNG